MPDAIPQFPQVTQLAIPFEGHVIDCDGTRAIISAEVDPNCEWKENYWAVGMLISIWEGRKGLSDILC